MMISLIHHVPLYAFKRTECLPHLWNLITIWHANCRALFEPFGLNIHVCAWDSITRPGLSEHGMAVALQHLFFNSFSFCISHTHTHTHTHRGERKVTGTKPDLVVCGRLCYRRGKAAFWQDAECEFESCMSEHLLHRQHNSWPIKCYTGALWSCTFIPDLKNKYVNTSHQNTICITHRLPFKCTYSQLGSIHLFIIHIDKVAFWVPNNHNLTMLRALLNGMSVNIRSFSSSNQVFHRQNAFHYL